MLAGVNRTLDRRSGTKPGLPHAGGGEPHRETVREWHTAASSYRWSLAGMRERRRDPYWLTEDARQFVRICHELDRSGYGRKAPSTHLPEGRRYRGKEGDATDIPFWPRA